MTYDEIVFELIILKNIRFRLNLHYLEKEGIDFRFKISLDIY